MEDVVMEGLVDTSPDCHWTDAQNRSKCWKCLPWQNACLLCYIKGKADGYALAGALTPRKNNKAMKRVDGADHPHLHVVKIFKLWRTRV